jgi:hypothetical protein
MLVTGLIYSSALKMEAVHSSETSLNFYHTTYHYIPKGNTLLLFSPCLALCKRRTENESKREQSSVENIWISEE